MDSLLISEWQAFLLIGTILGIIEIFVPGMVLLPIGIGAILTALLSLIAPLPLSLIFWGVSSLTIGLGLRKFFNKRKGASYQSGVEGMVGQKARVIEAINSKENTGRVKLFGDEWEVLSEIGSDPVKVGETVEIIEFVGNKVKIQPYYVDPEDEIAKSFDKKLESDHN